MINLGFWGKLKKPIMVLAPMADVTDCAFRSIIAKYGKPDAFFTEFVSADGLCSPGRPKLLIDLKYSIEEHPIVAQIFGSKPENINGAAILCKELGFDGVDINMGCPESSVVKQCSGAALIKDPKLAKDIIRAAKEGAEGLPISIKTRIGFNPPGGTTSRAGKNEMESWIHTLLEEDIAVLTVHLRTKKEMSSVPAHWELLKRIVEIRNKLGKETLILGNGDVVDLKDAEEKIKETGCDGIMLGRAIFGNPWLFSVSSGHEAILTFSNGDVAKQDILRKSPKLQNNSTIVREKLKVMIEHTKLFEEMLGKHKNFATMKKHYKAYVNGFDGAKELRMKLMDTKNASQVENLMNEFLKIRPAP